MEKGKAVVIAAHNPTFDGKLSDNPGYLAIRAAQLIENAVVVPVAIQVGEPWEKLGMGKTWQKQQKRNQKQKLILASQ